MAANKNANNAKQKTPLGIHLVAGGIAGLAEACVCHPLDTIKVRMQLSRSHRGKGVSSISLPVVERESCSGRVPRDR
jgi:solute carrier family 25 citrate transporter 1